MIMAKPNKCDRQLTALFNQVGKKRPRPHWWMKLAVKMGKS